MTPFGALLLPLTVLTYVTSGSRALWETVPAKGGRQAEGSSCHFLNIDGEGKMYVFGGRTGVLSWSEVILSIFDTKSKKWSYLHLQGEEDIERRNLHTAVNFDNKLYIFGGKTGVFSRSNDLIVLDLKELTIKKILDAKGTAPEPRSSHSAAIVEDKMYVYGGELGSDKVLGDLHVYDIAANSWSTVTPSEGEGGARMGHQLIAYGNSLYLTGGFDGKHTYDTTVKKFNLQTGAWSVVSTEEMQPRSGHSATLVGSTIYHIAGHNDGSKLDSVSAFELDTGKWIDVSVSGKLAKRQGHCAAVDPLSDGLIYVFGGSQGFASLYSDLSVLHTNPSEEQVARSRSSPVERDEATRVETLISRWKLSGAKQTKNETDLLANQMTDLLGQDLGDFPVKNLGEKVDLCQNLAPKNKLIVESEAKLNAERERVEAVLAELQSLANRHVDEDSELDALFKQIRERQNEMRVLKKQQEEEEQKYQDHDKLKTQLKDQVKRFQDARDLKKRIFDDRKKQLQDSKRKLVDAKALKDKTTRTLSGFDAELAKWETQEASIEVKLTTIRGEILVLEETVAGAAAAVQSAKTNRSDLEDRIAKINAILEDRERVIDQLTEASVKLQEARSGSEIWMLEAANNDVDVGSPKSTKCDIGCGVSTGLVDEYAAKLVVKRDELMALLNKRDTEAGGQEKEYRANKEKLERQVDDERKTKFDLVDVQHQKERKKNERDTNKLKEDHLTDLVGKLEAEQARMEDEVANAQAQLDAGDKQVKDQKQKLAKEEEDFHRYGDRRVELQKKVHGERSDISKLMDQAEKKIENKEDLKRGLEDVKKKKHELERTYRTAFNRHKGNREDALTIINRLFTGCEDERGARVACQEALEVQRGEVSKGHKENLVLKGEIEQLEQKNAELERQLEAALKAKDLCQMPKKK